MNVLLGSPATNWQADAEADIEGEDVEYFEEVLPEEMWAREVRGEGERGRSKDVAQVETQEREGAEDEGERDGEEGSECAGTHTSCSESDNTSLTANSNQFASISSQSHL